MKYKKSIKNIIGKKTLLYLLPKLLMIENKMKSSNNLKKNKIISINKKPLKIQGLKMAKSSKIPMRSWCGLKYQRNQLVVLNKILNQNSSKSWKTI